MGLVRDPLADLRRRLGRTRRTPAQLRAIVRRWWRAQGFAELPDAVGKRVACALLEKRGSLKHAGIVMLADPLGDSLRASDLASFERLYAAGQFSAAADNDAFATGVLGRLLAREDGRLEVLRALVAWREASTADQRRAACIALATLAPEGDAAAGVVDAILVVCAAIVWSPNEIDHSAVGDVLRELSRAEPLMVEAFFRRYARFLSPACARRAISRLPAAKRTELLAHHKRATTLRR
ncbi:MAG: DNA alkylation repair protein [Myxococcales bacterium]|nr:DNA alkylation repair protein [Myxococcales bacterium]